jgi:hypothetical protein
MMKTKLLAAAGLALCVGLLTALHAADTSPNARANEPTPEQIINKAIRAEGGADRLEGLSGFTEKTRTVYADGPTWTREITVQLPGRYRAENKIGPEGKTRSLVVIDGDHGWLKVNADVTPYPSSFAKSMQQDTIPFLGPRSILRLHARQKNPKCHFSTAGECTIAGHAAVGLCMKLDGGPQETWSFDKESGRLLQEESRIANFEGPDTVTVTTYTDYQTFDGFPLARKASTQRDGKPAWTRELIEFQVATPSPAAFAKP